MGKSVNDKEAANTKYIISGEINDTTPRILGNETISIHNCFETEIDARYTARTESRFYIFPYKIGNIGAAKSVFMQQSEKKRT